MAIQDPIPDIGPYAQMMGARGIEDSAALLRLVHIEPGEHQHDELGFALTTGGFAMIYKIMPRVRVQWRDVWLGAAVTALLFTMGRLLIGLYIGKSGVASTFGAAGSLIVVLVWVYYSAQIFLIGAEFTWVYARALGSMRRTAESPR